LSNFLKVNLNQFGTDWVRYVPTTAYAYNSFSSPRIGNFSPFELAFGRKPANLTNLVFNPMSGLTHSYGEYAALLKKRFDHLSRVMLQLQGRQQNAQQVKVTSKLSKSPIYSEGQLVYLYKPTSSSLTANSRKIAAEWCGPLVIHQVLDRTHYLLATLTGEVLNDVFNFNRLKPSFVRASSETSNITDITRLQKVLKENQNNSVNVMLERERSVIFCDEHDEVLPNVTSEDIVCTGLTDVVDVAVYLENGSQNAGFAFPKPISHDCIFKQLDDTCSKTCYDGMIVKRARYKLGCLQVLMALADSNDPTKESTFWWNIGQYANTEAIENFLMENNVRITGSPKKMLLTLYEISEAHYKCMVCL